MGEVADFANGTISLCRGDFLDAGLSFASMIPVVGDAIGKGGKVAKGVVENADVVVKNLDEAVEKTKEVATATKLRPNQKHHFATNKHSYYTKEMSKIADKFGLKLDGDWNKELLPHQERHPNEYHDFVLKQMKRADIESEGSKEKFLELYDKYVKKPVRNNLDLLRKSGWED